MADIWPTDILATGAEFFAFFMSVAFKLAVAYAAYWVASQFSSPVKNKMPSISAYPLQSSSKVVPKAKTYGTDRVAGNIIWIGDLHPYTVKHESGGGKGGGSEVVTYETRYRRSFLISMGEGPAQVLAAWKGKDAIELSEFSWFRGADNTGILNLTGEDYGKYKNNVLAWFSEYELGNSQTIPNFTFEISTVTGLKYTYYTDDAYMWGAPLFGTQLVSLDKGGAAVDVGGGIVGLPMRCHPFIAGDVLSISGTTNYNGTYTLAASTTADELHIADSYVAETFDGSEILLKVIEDLETGSARADQDASGNIYINHIYNAESNSYITKIEPDGTFVTDAVTFTTLPAVPESATCFGIKLTDDDEFLYVLINNILYKFDLSDGSEVWAVSPVGYYDIDVDANDRVYASVSNNVSVVDPATGIASSLSNMGDRIGGTDFNYVYDIHIDRRLGLVCEGGYQSRVAAGDAAVLYNFAVRTLDNNYGDYLAVGGTYVSIGMEHTYKISVGCIASNGQYIYVLIADSANPTRTIYKYSWNTITYSLELEASITAPGSSLGIHFDAFGHLVVVQQDGTKTDPLWFYDADLNYITKVENFPVDFCSTWGGVGHIWKQGVAMDYRGIKPGQLDANPADIIYDLATNERYGARLGGDYIDTDSFDDCWQYWQDKDMLLSLTLDESKSWQDWIDYILSHCGGYRFKRAGKLALGVLRDETAVADLDDDDLVQPDGDADTLPPKVAVVQRPQSDTFNRIEVAWSDRDRKYDISVAVAYDPVDPRRSETLRTKTVKLLGIKTAAHAQIMAYRFLIDALYRFNVYTFSVGFNRQLLEIGDVVTLSDGHLLSNEKIRLMKIQEDRRGGNLAITAMDDYAEHYPDIAFAGQNSLWEAPEAVVLADGSVYFREDMDEPKLYLSIVPANEYANGWFIYKSTDDATFEVAGRCGIDGVTGGDANSAGATIGTLPAHGSAAWAPDESVLVDIGTVTDLPTSISEDRFWSDGSLARIGSEIIAFKTATETATAGIWQISNLRRGLFGTEPAAHGSGEDFCTLFRDFTAAFNEADIGRTLYFKVLTYYADGNQTLGDVDSFSVTVGGYCVRPAAASLLRLSADENDGGSGDYSGSSFTLYWNLGSKVSGWNFGGWDVSGGGAPWNNYIADAELQAVVLKFEQSDGTAIGQREIAVGESATITKATDLGGHNPARIRVVPRRVYESRLQNSLLVDDGS
jgi:hypothetical protein